MCSSRLSEHPSLHLLQARDPHTDPRMTSGGDDRMTIASDLVVTKYKMAAEIANKVLRELLAECTLGSSVRDLCSLGDKKLLEETSKAYKKDKKMSKGDD